MAMNKRPVRYEVQHIIGQAMWMAVSDPSNGIDDDVSEDVDAFVFDMVYNTVDDVFWFNLIEQLDDDFE
jgi:hypothetical protein